MKQILKLVSPVGPSVNDYLNYKIATGKCKKKYVLVYHSHETEVYRNFFIDYVKDQIREQGWQRPEKGKIVYVKCTFYLERKRKDPHNFYKVMMDCLTEAGVYIDDDTSLPITERLYIDKLNPRIEIEIYESDAIGIFNNKEEYEKFIEVNCSNCKKKTENCSLLKQILDNRIIPEIQNGVCERRK